MLQGPPKLLPTGAQPCPGGQENPSRPTPRCRFKMLSFIAGKRGRGSEEANPHPASLESANFGRTWAPKRTQIWERGWEAAGSIPSSLGVLVNPSPRLGSLGPSLPAAAGQTPFPHPIKSRKSLVVAPRSSGGHGRVGESRRQLEERGCDEPAVKARGGRRSFVRSHVQQPGESGSHARPCPRFLEDAARLGRGGTHSSQLSPLGHLPTHRGQPWRPETRAKNEPGSSVPTAFGASPRGEVL